jgi:hypothetical protein
MTNTIKYKWHTIHVRPDADWWAYADSPRERWPISKLCISPNKRYDYPCELEIDRDSVYNQSDDDYDQIAELSKDYRVIRVDRYQHWSTTFSVASTGTQCDFDTSNACWIICIPKEYNSYDNEVRSQSDSQNKWSKIVNTEEEAFQIATNELSNYNTWLNWDLYEYEVEELEEFVGNFYSEEGALDQAKWSVDYAVSNNIKKHIRKLKRWIKSKVPLMYREPLSVK